MSKNIVIDKKLFREVCASLVGLPLFYQDWWLDTVSEAGEWDVLLYVEDPDIIAIYTFYKRRERAFFIHYDALFNQIYGTTLFR